MSEKLLTVVTSTFNRKHLLPRLYESLKKQTVNNFVWIIADDGSTDGTEELVRQWQNENALFEIRYFYKENEGMFSACRMGVERTDTELVINIDSDDWLPEDGCERIEKIWNEIRERDYVGFVGLDFYENGKVVGEKFPENIKEFYQYENVVYKYHRGDKKYIHRTEIMKKTFQIEGFPVKGERFFNPMYAVNKTYKYGKYYVVNECFCIIEYQPGGLSKNKLKQYYNSPNNFAEFRRLHLEFPKGPFMYFFNESIHYVSSCVIAGKSIKALKKSPRKWNTFFAYPFGILLAWYIIFKNKRN